MQPPISPVAMYNGNFLIKIMMSQGDDTIYVSPFIIRYIHNAAIIPISQPLFRLFFEQRIELINTPIIVIM